MRLATPFDPIEVGEIDNFAFDFTADMGASSIVSTNWTCALAPYQTATDPTPQSRVLAASARTTIEARSPIDGSLQMRNGFFSVASVGGCRVPPPAVLTSSRPRQFSTMVACSSSTQRSCAAHPGNRESENRIATTEPRGCECVGRPPIIWRTGDDE